MSDERAVELILDASGSMRGNSIKDAKEVLKSLVAEDLPDDIPVAVRVFGLTDGCSTALVMPLTPLTASTRKELQKKIEGIEAKGDTMIAGSLAMVKNDLASAAGKRHVVLVTDGEESCKGDVEAALKDLKNLGFDLRLDIVGIAPPNSPLHDTFKKWAKVADGEYLQAHDSDKLREALRELLPKRSWLDKLADKLKDGVEDVIEGGEKILKAGKDAVDDAIDSAKK